METSQAITNCPFCGRHCPIESPNCERGQALAEKLKNGEAVNLDAIRSKRGNREHEEHRESHRHHRGGRHGQQ